MNIIWIRVVIMAQTVSECAVKVSWSHQDRKVKEIKKGFYLWNVYSSLEFFGSFHHPVEQINITKKKKNKIVFFYTTNKQDARAMWRK